MKLPFLWWLWFYRNGISPLDGPRCGMWPTCSAYGTAAIRAHGPLFGGFLAADRLIHEGSARPPEYDVVEHYGRRWIHDPVEKNDRLFRRETKTARVEPPIAERRHGESLSLPALIDPAVARESARQLRAEGRGWDAITEWRRAAFLSTDRATASADLSEAGWSATRAAAEIADRARDDASRARAEDAFDDADRLFDDARKEAIVSGDAALVFRAEYGRAFASLARGYRAEAARRFERLGSEGDAEAAWLSAWARFGVSIREGETPREAAKVFAGFEADPVRGSLARDALEYAEGERVGRRSPQVAASMQLVLPGAGYAYAGRPLIGLGSLALNAAFVTAAVLAIREGNYPLAAILVSAETGWYFGGAAGAAQAALDRNRTRADRVERRMRKRFLGAVGPNGAAAAILF